MKTLKLINSINQSKFPTEFVAEYFESNDKGHTVLVGQYKYE